MWPWTKRVQNRDLEERIERLERTVKGLEVEWNGWFDQYRRLYARLAKREQRAADEPDSPQESRSPNGRGSTNPLAARLMNPYG